jgi:hypothetical protein
MATAKDFRRGIAECSKDAIARYPTNDLDRLNCFVALFCGWIRDDEPEAAADLWRVLSPTEPMRNPDGA